MTAEYGASVVMHGHPYPSVLTVMMQEGTVDFEKFGSNLREAECILAMQLRHVRNPLYLDEISPATSLPSSTSSGTAGRATPVPTPSAGTLPPVGGRQTQDKANALLLKEAAAKARATAAQEKADGKKPGLFSRLLVPPMAHFGVCVLP